MTRYNLQSIYSVEDLRNVTDSTGSHFFSPRTMQWWGSRVLSLFSALDGYTARRGARYLFATSDKPTRDTPRVYSLRLATLTALNGRAWVEIETLSTHDTLSELRKAHDSLTYSRDNWRA